MKLLKLILRFYIDTAKESLKLVIKNWPVVFALVIYSIIINITRIFIGSIITMKTYFIGGIILGLIATVCTGSYLYLIQNVINYKIININDFKNSFLAYVNRVIDTAFYMWIFLVIYGLIFEKLIYLFSYGWIIRLTFNICLFIVLNPLPEMLYQTHNSAFGLFISCVEFTKENFWAWILPNLLFAAAINYLFYGNINPLIKFNVLSISKYFAGLFVFFYFMVFRGLLFKFINDSKGKMGTFKKV